MRWPELGSARALEAEHSGGVGPISTEALPVVLGFEFLVEGERKA